MLFYILPILILIYLFLLRGRHGHPGLRNIRGWKYAHRGLHNAVFPENSMGAFRKAVEAGYGIELDVHLMADGKLAVIHDSLLARTTGLPGRIEELTAADLPNCKLTGCNEGIPLFTDVLKMVDGRVPLIVELKAENNNHITLTQAVCEVLDEYKGVFCVESFDPRCVQTVKKIRPHIIRGQLAHNSLWEKSSVPWLLRFVCTNLLMNFLCVTDFVAYRYKDRKCLSVFLCRKFWGLQGVSWTIKNVDDWNTAIKEDWVTIFEGYSP